MHAVHGSSRTLSGEWSSQSSFSIHLPQQNTEDIDETREEENHAGFKETYGDESTQAHGNIVKSGFLGRCDDPYCTTCPYEDWSETAPQTKGDRGNLIGKLKDKWVKGSKPFRSFPGIFSPHTKLIQRWNQLFAISSLVAVFIDPLFFFIFSVEEDELCISFNAKLAMVITILRSITDTLYFLHMLLQFRLAYIVPASKTTRTGILESNPKRIALHYLKGWFLIDFVAVIPLPQILLWFVVKRNTKTGKALYLKDVLRAVVLLQYLPRVVRLLPVVVRGSQGGFIFETAWTNFLMNFFLYILAAHVVGSCWYLFGLQRVNECLHQTCDNETPTCQPSFLDCGSGGKSSKLKPLWINNTSAKMDCFSSDSSFDYGIYGVSLPVTSDTNFAVKYVYSLFWGFLQISTLGGNLTPSIFAGEVVFTISVISLGLLLFALLIGNMQNFLQYLTRRQMEMQFKSYDVEAWMKRRSMSPDLQRQVRQAVRFKWLSTRGVDEEQLIENLPEDLQLEIRRFLCFRLVKKVPIFTVMDEQVLDAICERLQKRLYIKGSEILQAYGPINRMLFIVRGKLLSVGKDGSRIGLSSGDFCGEELLNWCLGQYANQPGARRSPSVMKSAGHRAISSRTVRAETSVEAFSLEEKDLLYVTKHYSRHMRNPRVQGAIRYHSPYFRSWAANSIQAAWKYRQRKKGQKSMAQQQEYYQE